MIQFEDLENIMCDSLVNPDKNKLLPKKYTRLTIENGSVIVKCSGRGGINLVIKSLSKNPSELIIDEIQEI